MKNAVSCGGIVIYRGKILLLFINYRNRYEGWVLPKGSVEDGESFEETALREVREESGAAGSIVEYLGSCEYEFKAQEELVRKTVHWFLIAGTSFFSKPQKEEYFTDSGFYKYHEAYHLLKYDNERSMLEKAYGIYQALKKKGQWKEQKADRSK